MSNEQTIIDGKGIDGVMAYDSRYLSVKIDGEWYRLDMNKNLLGMLAEFKFVAEKKRVHTHITPILEGIENSIYIEDNVN